MKKMYLENNNTNLEVLRKEVKEIRKILDNQPTYKELFAIEQRVTLIEKKLGIKY